MIDHRQYCIIKKQVVKIGMMIEVNEGFFDSQSRTISGRYKLLLIDLDKIDVVVKRIANRDFFKWEDRQYLDNLKLNFYKTPPVILEKLNDLYYSVDGHHRITIAKELGLKNILSLVINVDKLSHPRN